MRRVKILVHGNDTVTMKVTDAESGEEISGVSAAHINVTPTGVNATLVLKHFELEATVDAEVKHKSKPPEGM
jgi:hypothetical protein